MVVVLNVGLPLWILQSTSASAGLVGVLYGTNAVLAVLLQTRVSRRVPTFLAAAHAQRLAGLLLAPAAHAWPCRRRRPDRATAAARRRRPLPDAAELLKASAAWQITFELAPAGRAAEFFSTYRLGATACSVVGPVLITAGVLALGSAGWALLGLAFVLGGIATPPLALRARARPVSPPTDAPNLTRLAAYPQSA